MVANAPDAHAQANAQVALTTMRLGDKTKARPIGYQLSGGGRHHLDALQGKLADQFDWLVVDEAEPHRDGERALLRRPPASPPRKLHKLHQLVHGLPEQ